MIRVIRESEMDFLVEDNNTFEIENNSKVQRRGLKSVEFIEVVNTNVIRDKISYIQAQGNPHNLVFNATRQNTILHFVEAKRSNPREYVLEAEMDADATEKVKKYNEYIHDIREKFQNSVSIYFSAMSKRKDIELIYNDFPLAMQNTNHKKIDCKLFLVVKNAVDPSWLVPIHEHLYNELLPFFKCWNITDSNFKVINEDYARNLHLIL